MPIITFDNDPVEGKYVEKAVIGRALRNVSLHQELPSKLVGLTTVETLLQMRTAVDEICDIFRAGLAAKTGDE